MPSGAAARSDRSLIACWVADGLAPGSLQLSAIFRVGSPGATVIFQVSDSPWLSTLVSSTMKVSSRRSHSSRRSGKPQPWCTRRLSELDALNEYCAAAATISALSVVKCGRFSKAVPPGARSALPNLPKPGVPDSSVNIWIARPQCPATIGVAPDVPPKPPVQLFDE